ncbi:MAG: adenosine deaminase [Catenulispora sp.]|nr:adenosine deaminase [Catenulispora sp.]
MINIRRVVVAGTTACLITTGVAAQARAVASTSNPTAAERLVDGYLDQIRGDAAGLRNFFYALPKGGDLHNHLSGAASTELLLRLAVQDGLCIDGTDTAVPGPCPSGARPAADTDRDPAFHDEVIRAWSMQDFVAGAESGHDHFFNAFGKFGEASWRHPGTLLGEVADTAAKQNQSYLETMITPASSKAAALAAKVGFDPDFAAMRAKLMADGALDAVVASARQDADAGMAEFQTVDHCGTPQATPGCSLTIRFVSQVSRGSNPARVFTQMLVAMQLASVDPRFVAVNLVQPEDSQPSLENYSLQMRMLDYLHPLYPKAHITLHAGELTPELVSPADLAFHIREAVNVGHAERIGHGVDVAWEKDAQQLLEDLAAKNVAVEVPLSSNEQILRVAGDNHPLPLYREYGVPVVLATDDQGISRIDVSGEYQKAATRYQLHYWELKGLARNSLDYAFVPGQSLWAGPDRTLPVAECRSFFIADYGLPTCKTFLAANPKAALEAKQEQAFAAFESTVLTGRLAGAPAEPRRV